MLKPLHSMMQNPLHSFRYCPRCGADGYEDYAQRAKRCRSCSLVYFHNVASAVACILRNKAGEYLFVRRAKEPARGTLDLAGGFVDPMESVEEAVRREIKEETGLQVEHLQYLTSRPNIYPYSGIEVYTSDLFFLVDCDSFEGATASDDAAELVITTLEDLRSEDFGLQSIRGFMAELLANPHQFIPR